MTAFDEDDVVGKAYDARLMRRFFRYVRPHRVTPRARRIPISLVL